MLQTLTFLQEAYEMFSEFSEEVRDSKQKRNKEIRDSFDSELTLRDLYVHLAMYDGVLSEAKSNQTEMEQKRTILMNRNRAILIHQIQQREQAQEVIEPSPIVISRANYEIKDVKGWLPLEIQDRFQRKLDKALLLPENQDQSINVVIKLIMMEYSKLLTGMNTLEQFADLVTIVESLANHHSSPESSSSSG